MIILRHYFTQSHYMYISRAVRYRQIHRNCPQRQTPSLNGGSTSRIHQHTAPIRGSASRIHQHTAPQKGVRLQNSSRYSPTKGGPPLEFINIQPPNYLPRDLYIITLTLRHHLAYVAHFCNSLPPMIKAQTFNAYMSVQQGSITMKNQNELDNTKLFFRRFGMYFKVKHFEIKLVGVCLDFCFFLVGPGETFYVLYLLLIRNHSLILNHT